MRLEAMLPLVAAIRRGVRCAAILHNWQGNVQVCRESRSWSSLRLLWAKTCDGGDAVRRGRHAPFIVTGTELQPICAG